MRDKDTSYGFTADWLKQFTDDEMTRKSGWGKRQTEESVDKERFVARQ